ncbi:4a-hydroxytetrahydrobiopterin dehydratase [Nocardioides carbamazepini]|uniref:4a-hydroxytetrahydrobiopterin dehydratase n=1 Tax=Nocardioides carbamazepini TaxID=2854259 RepID=UPI002149AA46|nr:4a-hydroxytetrahydrobiopterin dehydratase [Nocardioides carbamazepini]MCR1781078.1 4a-hydroxytetrahydrobiopterin dehydratase [Nocardioides carbamazepini]
MARSYEQISAERFSAAEGVGEWRVLGWHAFAVFRTGTFATGLALVNAIGELAEAADHHPDLKLGYPALAVRLATHDTESLTTADLDLAQRISAAARDLGVAGDPDAVRAWE